MCWRPNHLTIVLSCDSLMTIMRFIYDRKCHIRYIMEHNLKHDSQQLMDESIVSYTNNTKVSLTRSVSLFHPFLKTRYHNQNFIGQP